MQKGCIDYIHGVRGCPGTTSPPSIDERLSSINAQIGELLEELAQMTMEAAKSQSGCMKAEDPGIRVACLILESKASEPRNLMVKF